MPDLISSIDGLANFIDNEASKIGAQLPSVLQSIHEVFGKKVSKIIEDRDFAQFVSQRLSELGTAGRPHAVPGNLGLGVGSKADLGNVDNDLFTTLIPSNKNR